VQYIFLRRLLDVSNIYLLGSIPGKSYRVTEINGGHGVQKRLQDLGIVPGTELEIIQNDKRHPLLLRANGTVLMIGKGIAKKISVLENDSLEQDDTITSSEHDKGENRCHA